MSESVWFAIALIVMVVISTNVMLLLAWRHKDDSQKRGLMYQLKNDVSHSWKKEEEQIGELSKRVQVLTSTQDNIDE